MSESPIPSWKVEHDFEELALCAPSCGRCGMSRRHVCHLETPTAAPEPRSTPGPSTGTPEPSQAASEAHSDEVARLREALEQVRALADLMRKIDHDYHAGTPPQRPTNAVTAISVAGRLDAILASVDAPLDPEVPAFGEVTRAVTVDDLKALPARSVIAGPQWRDEVYQKTDADEWLLLGSPDPWSSGSVVHRGPFTILQSGRAGAVEAPAPDEADDDTLREAIDDAVWDVLSGYHEVMDVEARADEVADAVLAVLHNRGLIQ